ncbi:glycine-rich domain-containing protein [Streptomyces sp. NPDC007808]|uniref:glycine-rich domain-containing protein n=1 Tax=Streptomyces sp. NPDC007808 TaxID=3364779 RepID=UPI0036960FCB
MTIALERPVGTTDPITLVDPEVTERLARRITTEHPDINDATARRIVGQAAAFIAASGQQPGRNLVPSELVDYGWHAFILHTIDYADFCERVVGRFVHHVPTDDGNEQAPGGAAAARERTMAAIQAAGYTVDAELWHSAADCNQCHAGCHDSPKTG